MKVRLYFCVILLLLLPSSVIIKSTQTYYWIRFTDKNNINQPAPDEYSLAVAEEYLKKIQSLNIEIIGTSKWLNMALVRSTPRQVETLKSLTFIKNLFPVIKSQSKLTEYNSREADHSSIREKQLGWFEYDIIKKMGLTGKGIRIAVFDGGFPGTETHPGFQHLFNKNRIVATWNFPNNSQDVFRNNHHGTAVLSCITGQMNGQPTGLATNAEFLLARTELPGEPWREQLYWIQAAEWAEKNGANIICSALGYTYHHYFHENMDGSSPVAEAARVATSKGILVINSMGNDGDSKWKIVSTPADATEVLGVGGIDPETGLKASFSSFGPNTMGELKPNVVAPSTVVAATPTSWKIMYGTSFSAPLVAGFAACLWELHPGFSNVEIFKLIQQSGSLYPYYDYAHGYGVPQASRIYKAANLAYPDDFSIIQKEDSVVIRIIKPQSLSSPYLYYHLADNKGMLLEYQVVNVNTGDKIIIDTKRFPQLTNIRIHYGHTLKHITVQDDNK